MGKEPVVPYADPSAIPEALKAPLEAYAERMGFLPNALKLYLHRPELLACLIQLNNAVMRDPSSTLDAGLKRRLAAVCSAVNRSAYCVAHNANTLTSGSGGDGEGWDFSEADVSRLLDPDYDPGDPAERACFAYARAASLDPSAVAPEIRGELARRLEPSQVVELACVVGFWRMYNSIHEALDIPLEAELGG